MDTVAEFSERDRDRYRQIFSTLRDHLDEKTKRLLGAALALSLGRGGPQVIHEITGLSLHTLRLGGRTTARGRASGG